MALKTRDSRRSCTKSWWQNSNCFGWEKSYAPAISQVR